MLIYPDYLKPTENLYKITNTTDPVTTLDYQFEYPNMTKFMEVMMEIIHNGKLFEYEDYDYEDHGHEVNNLKICKNLYTPAASGYEFARYERIEDGRSINFTIYNKNVGWFPEIKDRCPDLVSACYGLIQKFNIDVWKILIVKVAVDLGRHMDMDGYYGFRLHLSDKPYNLDFRKIKPEYREEMQLLLWQGKWNEIMARTPEVTEDPDIPFTKEEVGQAFLNNSMDYVHYFHNPAGEQFFAIIKGVV